MIHPFSHVEKKKEKSYKILSCHENDLLWQIKFSNSNLHVQLYWLLHKPVGTGVIEVKANTGNCKPLQANSPYICIHI